MLLNLHLFVNHVMQFWLMDFSFSEQSSKGYLIRLIIEVSVSVHMGLNTDRIDVQANKRYIRLFTIHTFKYVNTYL